MAADSYHAAVERAMKPKPPVSFPDFKEHLQVAQKNVAVLDMLPEDFFETQFQISQYTRTTWNLILTWIKSNKSSFAEEALWWCTEIHWNQTLTWKVVCCLQKTAEMVTSCAFDLKTTLKFKVPTCMWDWSRKKKSSAECCSTSNWRRKKAVLGKFTGDGMRWWRCRRLINSKISSNCKAYGNK